VVEAEQLAAIENDLAHESPPLKWRQGIGSGGPLPRISGPYGVARLRRMKRSSQP
jgi:hypothetical protein